MLALVNQFHLPKLTVKSNSDFHISLNCTRATKNQWARIRGKHEKFQCLLRHLLRFFIISSRISCMPLPVLWHSSAILQGFFPCCHKFPFIPTIFNWRFEGNPLTLMEPTVILPFLQQLSYMVLTAVISLGFRLQIMGAWEPVIS